jgi:transposase
MKPKSSNAKSRSKAPAEQVVKDIRRKTRRHFSAEDKIRVVLDPASEKLEIIRIVEHQPIS